MTELPILLFSRQSDWADWLEEHHRTSDGVWLRISKKGSGIRSVSYAEALEVALCSGWIDGQKRAEDHGVWQQKFTPRRNKSIWSKINREKALALMDAGRMKAPGLAEIERAKADGRWEAAYDSSRVADVPSDFQAALDANPQAKDFFAVLDRANRYAVLFRLQTAKKAETRVRRIRQFIEMLEKKEKLHP